jgi:hypothetical protein
LESKCQRIRADYCICKRQRFGDYFHLHYQADDLITLMMEKQLVSETIEFINNLTWQSAPKKKNYAVVSRENFKTSSDRTERIKHGMMKVKLSLKSHGDIEGL